MYSSSSDQTCEGFAVMVGTELMDHQPAAAESHPGADDAFHPADLLNSAEVEDDHKLSGYIEDNFEFLDHMDCSSSYQVCHLGEDEI